MKQAACIPLKNLEDKNNKIEEFKNSKVAQDFKKAFPDAKLINLKEAHKKKQMKGIFSDALVDSLTSMIDREYKKKLN